MVGNIKKWTQNCRNWNVMFLAVKFSESHFTFKNVSSSINGLQWLIVSTY